MRQAPEVESKTFLPGLTPLVKCAQGCLLIMPEAGRLKSTSHSISLSSRREWVTPEEEPVAMGAKNQCYADRMQKVLGDTGEMLFQEGMLNKWERRGQISGRTTLRKKSLFWSCFSSFSPPLALLLTVVGQTII